MRIRIKHYNRLIHLAWNTSKVMDKTNSVTYRIFNWVIKEQRAQSRDVRARLSPVFFFFGPRPGDVFTEEVGIYLVLKIVMDSAVRIEVGRSFHHWGTVTLKVKAVKEWLMNKRIEGWMNRWMDGCSNGLIAWMDEWFESMGGRIDGFEDGRIDGLPEGWRDGWRDGRMDG